MDKRSASTHTGIVMVDALRLSTLQLKVQPIKKYNADYINQMDLKRIRSIGRACRARLTGLIFIGVDPFNSYSINLRKTNIPMLSLLSIRNTSLALSVLLLAGCAEFNAGWNGALAPSYNDPYAQSDFDELLAFGANMSKISPSSRTDVCRTLLKRQKNPPGPGIHLHLLVGRLFSDSCGDIPKVLNGVSSIPPGSLYDERMQRLVAIHTEALKRLQSASKKAGALERKQKPAQSVAESKDTNASKKDETRLLREKLDAIRSMEKQLDESGDAN